MDDLKALNPSYSVYIVSEGHKYNVTNAIDSLGRIDAEGQIAQRVNLQLQNAEVDGVHLSSILQPVNRLIVYANDGVKEDEVFRGFLWDRSYRSSLTEHKLKVTAYDNLIYLQESEDVFYFSAGKSTEQVVSSICRAWNIKLNYNYHSIKNGRLALSGNLYNILTTDVLDLVKDQTSNHYSVISVKDTMVVRMDGDNDETYRFIVGENISSAESRWTMEGVVTQVIVIGKAFDDGRIPVEISESRNAEKYGTLQKIQRKDEDTDIWTAHGAARFTLREKSSPIWEYEITCPDVPWIRKGDAVIVHAGDIVEKRLFVKAVNRTSDLKTSKMTLTLINTYIERTGDEWTST